jgi:hypothetical protein
MAAEVINIPLHTDHLYLLALYADNGTVLFRYLPDEEGVWLTIECHVSKGVTAVEESREVPGGAIRLRPLGADGITAHLAGQAERITQEQFKVWRDLSTRDRIALQIHWAEEELQFLEAQLLRAMCRPNPEGMKGRFDYEALESHMRMITRQHGELLGLRAAFAANWS